MKAPWVTGVRADPLIRTATRASKTSVPRLLRRGPYRASVPESKLRRESVSCVQSRSRRFRLGGFDLVAGDSAASIALSRTEMHRYQLARSSATSAP
jgi:hypothetical protein